MNAWNANSDTLLQKDNNYIFYDSDGAKRLYIPWDLDTTMQSEFDPFTGTVPGGTSKYTDVLLPGGRRQRRGAVEPANRLSRSLLTPFLCAVSIDSQWDTNKEGRAP